MGNEMTGMQIVFPHANNQQIELCLFIAAWTIWCEQFTDGKD